MQVVVGVFNTQSQAEGAMLRLRESGYSEEQLALVANVEPGEAPIEPAAETHRPASTEMAAGRAEPASAAAGSGNEITHEDARAAAAPPHSASRPGRPNVDVYDVAPRERDETADAADTGGAPQLAPTSAEENRAVDTAAIGGAIGVIAGGGIGGPLGMLVGGVAGTSIAAWLGSRTAADSTKPSYADELGLGRYLLAVEVDGPAAEVHNLLSEAGATRVEIEPM